jgi:hypothetical protein
MLLRRQQDWKDRLWSRLKTSDMKEQALAAPDL